MVKMESVNEEWKMSQRTGADEILMLRFSLMTNSLHHINIFISFKDLLKMFVFAKPV